MADRFLLGLVRQRGHELIRIHQARQIGTHDNSAEVAEDVYTECFDAIAIERAASRDELEYERESRDELERSLSASRGVTQ